MDEVVLFADFDSANMARYERVVKTPASLLNSILSGQYSGGNQKTTSSSSSNNNSNNANSNTNATDKENSDNSVITNQFVTQKYDYEFNVWTRADCEDSSVGANSNRTWFYFGVRGGQGKFIKFNIMNMNKQNKLFEMGMLPVFKTIPGHEKWARIYLKPIWQTVDQNFMMSFIHRIPDKKDSVTYFAFCFPFSYEECQSMLKKYDEQFDYCRRAPSFDTKCDPDQIYYHRELFTETLDKRRVDLITVSSYHQIIYRREPRFDPDHLFPDPNNPRPFRFDKKRVYVLTSRVHPGETPSSFVFNGFLEFILRSQDPRARILRRQFVFKLIPLLNPDGVARGYYRTDQLGVNLNRVYLDPNPTLHPSIYAAKSLLVYHHIYNRSSRELDGLNFDHVFKLRFDVDDQELIDQPNPSNDIIYTDEPTLQGHSVLKDDDDIITPSTSSLSPSWPHQQNHLVLNKISSSTSARNQNNVLLIESNRFPSTTNRSLDINNFFSSTERTHASNTTKSNKSNSIGTNLTRSLDFLVRTHTETMMKRDAVKVIGEKRIGNENSDEEEGEQGEPLTAKTTGPTSMSTNPFDTNINSPHLNDPKLLMINPLWSGVAFYVDLHGHAGKRGCFIYGNSIDNELYQVENVLFARLIAFSSQHFDFDGCNFSVKNMYMRDKGCQSKEGSGRVAMYKVLGLIHSYTLECSYSSGRVMNNLAPAINTSGPTYYINGTRCQYVSGSVSPPLHNDLPPKFLQEHYADVGKGLAIAALDLIEMNPHTRIPNTSFGSLEAVRNWVKFYIRSRIGGGISVATSGLQPANSASSAALSNSNSSNALPVNIVSSASSGALNNASSNVAKKSFINQKSNPQRLSANQSQKSMSQQSKSNNSSSSTLTSLSKVSSNSSNLNKLKPQTRKSLTPQQEIMTTKATITTTTIAPPNTTILDRSKMVSQRRSLGKLIMEYESMEKTQVAEIAAGAENIDTSTVSSNGSGGGKTSIKPTSASSTHKTSMFHTMFSAISEPPVREPTNVVNSGGNQSTKSDSSISSSETVKPNISNTPETNIKPLEESREKKTSKDRFKLRKPMSISKASVLSNTTTTTATNNQPDVISSLMMDQPMTGRSSVATVRNMAAAYANIMPTSTTKQPNSLPNTMRLKTSQAALSRGFTALEPAQFFAPAKSSPATSSSSKAISEPIVYLSLNKLLNKNKASDNEHRRSYQQQSSMVLKTSGIETIKLKRK